MPWARGPGNGHCSRYATFSGRARRSEYWWFVLFNIIVSVVARLVDAAVLGESTGYLSIIAVLALFLPGLGVTVRRLHDIGKRGWWILLALVPIVGAIVLIVWAAKEGDAADNAYGPSPKAQFAPTEAGLAGAVCRLAGLGWPAGLAGQADSQRWGRLALWRGRPGATA